MYTYLIKKIICNFLFRNCQYTDAPTSGFFLFYLFTLYIIYKHINIFVYTVCHIAYYLDIYHQPTYLPSYLSKFPLTNYVSQLLRCK